MKENKTILYFGNFDPNFSRNKVYIGGLRQNGYKVLICADSSRGLLKYWKLFFMHRKLKNLYDVMIVGYPGYIIMPFARLLTRKMIIFDALCSQYETRMISRDAPSINPFKAHFIIFMDKLANMCADYILVESERQKSYFIQRLGANARKLIVVYTGADDKNFYYDPDIKKRNKFTVVFRGRITREAGAEYVIRAAKILEDSDIDFLVIGFGWGDAQEKFDEIVRELKPRNLEYIGYQVPIDQLRLKMLECQACLGQFSSNERLQRTIPHKAYEAMVMKLPYITAKVAGAKEIFTDGENCLMVEPANGEDLALKIKELRNSEELCQRLALKAYDLYNARFEPQKIVQPIVKLLR